MNLPTGTITFFFSDMEGSTRLVQELGDAWPSLLEAHDEIVRRCLSRNGGIEVRTEGDAFFVAFPAVSGAVAAAAEAQAGIAAYDWPDGREVRIRIGLHTGAGVVGGSDYVGLDVHRAARIASVAHPGQILMSEATAVVAERDLPAGTELRDLGKHRLKDLFEREALFQLVVPGVSDEFPALETLEGIPNNLPVQVTSFVGREDDLATARALLDSHRIVTLLGPGGTGKTRLSLQLAAELADQFPDGVYFVALAPVTDGDLIAPTILSTIGVRVGSGSIEPRAQLLNFIEDKSILFVLDNFEQLSGSSEIVAEMAARSAGSKFLVSSRVPLRVRGEQELPIPPLNVAGPGSDLASWRDNEAVHLFVERAQAVQPGFTLTSENTATVAELVSRLDGLPLAIELVVPKLKVLPVEAILARLDPATLTSGARDAPERHQTMWNAIAWSEESLPPECQRLFARMAVFAGGWRLEELERVCGTDLGVDVLEGLAALVDSSLVLRDGDGSRFRMLQVIREFAARKLADSGEADEIRRRHALAYCDRAEEAFPELTGRNRRHWLEDLDRDHDNLRAGLAACIAMGHVDGALRYAWSMWRYWQIRGHLVEARRRVDEVLAMEGGDPARRAKALEALGGIAWWQGDIPTCDRAYAEALELQRGLDNRRELANALYNRGLVEAFFLEQADSGRRLIEESLAIYEELGDVAGMADAHWGMGNMLIFGFDHSVDSISHLDKSIEGYRAVGNVFGEGWGHFELGEAYRRLGEHDTALPHYERGLQLLYDSGEVSATVLFVMGFAALALESGDLARAYRLAGAAFRAADRSGIDIISVAANRVEGLERDKIEEATGALAEAYQEGSAMSYDEAVEYALGR